MKSCLTLGKARRTYDVIPSYVHTQKTSPQQSRNTIFVPDDDLWRLVPKQVPILKTGQLIARQRCFCSQLIFDFVAKWSHFNTVPRLQQALKCALVRFKYADHRFVWGHKRQRWCQTTDFSTGQNFHLPFKRDYLIAKNMDSKSWCDLRVDNVWGSLSELQTGSI